MARTSSKAALALAFVVAPGPAGSFPASILQQGLLLEAEQCASCWYTGITYLGDGGSVYGTCTQPTFTEMNDENVGTKPSWGSYSSLDATLRADLGSVKQIDRIRVGGNGPGTCWSPAGGYWNAAGANLLIQVSNDATTWTTVATGNAISYSNTAMQNIVFPVVSARYIRLYAASSWLATGQFRVGYKAP